MKVAIFLVISLVGILQSMIVDAAKGKSAVAIPRKSKGNPISRSVFGSMFSRAFREMKVTFCSELEALTLQLTRPTDTQVSLKNLDELVRCLNAEYDNPQFTVSLLAKFSRKLCEPNVFTKLKSLICLHKMMQECDSNAQNAFTQSVRSLKSERDEKVGVSFFSNESIEQAAGSASTVAELEAVELAREYSAYVLNFIDFRGEKPARSNAKSKVSKKEVDGDDRAEMLLELVELSELVQKCCKQSQSGQVVMQCLSCVMEDRPWLTKQMQKVYEAGLDDEELEVELEQALKKWDSKFKSKAKIASANSVKSVIKSVTEREEKTKEKAVKSVVEDEDDEDDDDEEEEIKAVVKPAVATPIVSKASVASFPPVAKVVESAPAPVSVSAPVVAAATEKTSAIKAHSTSESSPVVRSTAAAAAAAAATPIKSSQSSVSKAPKESKDSGSKLESAPKAAVLKKKVSKEAAPVPVPVPSVKKSEPAEGKKAKKSSATIKNSASASSSRSSGSKTSKDVKSSSSKGSSASSSKSSKKK